MRTVVEARTRKHPEDGFSLLREDLWIEGMGFHAGVSGYLSGLPRRSNWLEVREQLRSLIPERVDRIVPEGGRDVPLQNEHRTVDLAVAQAWAQHDLNEAVNWYARSPSSEGWLGDISTRTLNVLNSVPIEDAHRVADWMDANHGQPSWNDRVVIDYLRSKSNVEPVGAFERMVALPQGEEHRIAIVSGFASPREKDGQFYLRHPPESLERLVRAANLSPAETDRWLQTIAEAIPPGA